MTQPLTLDQLMTLPSQHEPNAAILAWAVLQLNEQLEHLTALVQTQQDLLAQERASHRTTARMRDVLLDQVMQQDVDLRHRRVLLPPKNVS